jgi:hypothetical protein
VIVWLPDDLYVTEQLAAFDALSGRLPQLAIGAPPSRNATVPDGATAPPTAGETLAVKVTAEPAWTLGFDTSRPVAVPLAATASEYVPPEGAKFAEFDAYVALSCSGLVEAANVVWHVV